MGANTARLLAATPSMLRLPGTEARRVTGHHMHHAEVHLANPKAQRYAASRHARHATVCNPHAPERHVVNITVAAPPKEAHRKCHLPPCSQHRRGCPTAPPCPASSRSTDHSADAAMYVVPPHRRTGMPLAAMWPLTSSIPTSRRWKMPAARAAAAWVLSNT